MSGLVYAAAPTGILLDSQIFYENNPDGNSIAIITAVDADVGDTHNFELVDGVGSQDNHGFSIYKNELLLHYEPEEEDGFFLDFEKQSVYSIRLRVRDSADNYFDQVFLLTMVDDETEDNDQDGLNEVQEDLLGTNDRMVDTDGDGFNDGIESQLNSSPTDINEWPDYPLVGWGHNTKRELMAPGNAGFSMLSSSQTHGLGLKYDGTVAAWAGENDYGQTSVPPGLGQVVQISSGQEAWVDDSGHSLALKSDGTVVAWGYTHKGVLTPPVGLTGVVEVSAGRMHDLALKSDGTVVVWGDDTFGQTDIPAGLQGVVAVSAGGMFSMALKSDGTVVSWGSTFDGEEWHSATVPTGLHDVVAISAGRFHSLALKADGTVVAWGYGEDGQTSVPTDLSDVVAIDAGGFHSLALKGDGSVAAWGRNTWGQSHVPLAAHSEVVAIAAGLQHSLAIRRSSGYPHITSSRVISVAPGESMAHEIVTVNAVALSFTALGLPDGLILDPVTGIISGTVTQPVRRTVRIREVTDQGVVYQNLWIQVSVGTGPTELSLSPAVVLENAAYNSWVGTLTATDPDPADTHTFSLVDGAGSADNDSFRIIGNQLFVNQRLDRDFEVNPSSFSIRVRAVDASLNPYEVVIPILFTDDALEDIDKDGLSEAQELLAGTSDTKYDKDGDGFGDGLEVRMGTSPLLATSKPSGTMLVAWGNNDLKQLAVPAGLGEVTQVAAGWGHSLALNSSGILGAWGWNQYGQCTIPTNLSGVVAVDAGDTHSLALKSDGTVVAWGGNQKGESTVPESLSGVVAIAAGGRFSLALKGNGTVVAWGDDEFGQTQVPAGLADVVAISAGGFHALALKNDGTVVAWGWSGATVIPAGLGRVVAVSAGRVHSLALKYDGSVMAWGNNDSGQLYVPSNLVSAAEIGAGWLHNVARKTDGSLVSWGFGKSGETTAPVDAVNLKAVSVGDQHNVAVRQASVFPSITSIGTIQGWPGQSVAYQVSVAGAVASSFSALGLPAGLSIHPTTGLISGMVDTVGARRSVRITANTDKGQLNRVLWLDTMDGHAPTDIVLTGLPISIMENSPAGTLLGTFSAVDVDAGDSHVFSVLIESGSTNPYCLSAVGNRLEVSSNTGLNYENGAAGVIEILISAVDAGNNVYQKNFTIQLIDDREEDEDGDGVTQAMEDVFQSSDTHAGDFVTLDVDHDGMSALIEYAFNLDVGTPDIRYLGEIGSTSGLPLIRTIIDGEGHQRLRLEYLRRIGSSLNYRPQFSSDMKVWTAPTAPVVVVWSDAEWERCVVDDTQFTPSPGRRFGRVGVEWVVAGETTGSAPTGISLTSPGSSGSFSGMMENLPAGGLVGNLAVSDTDPGDTHTFTVTVISGPVDPDYFMIAGNQLLVASSAARDYESNSETLTVRIRATDSHSNYYEQNFSIPLIDDRHEDHDGDGIDEATEEDIVLTSDLIYDAFATMDTDHDGISTLIEYAFNLDPLASDGGKYLENDLSTSGLPLIHRVVDAEGRPRLRIEFLRRIDSALTYVPQFSSSLSPGSWGDATGPVVRNPLNTEWEHCVVDDTERTSSPDVRFGRVKVGP